MRESRMVSRSAGEQQIPVSLRFALSASPLRLDEGVARPDSVLSSHELVNVTGCFNISRIASASTLHVALTSGNTRGIDPTNGRVSRTHNNSFSYVLNHLFE